MQLCIDPATANYNIDVDNIDSICNSLPLLVLKNESRPSRSESGLSYFEWKFHSFTAPKTKSENCLCHDIVSHDKH